MIGTVLQAIHDFDMAHSGDAIGVAVSGGADSVCLLHVLVRLAPELGITLRVLHLNHRLRGEESDEDARFVAELAASLQLPCTISRVPRDLLGEGENLEQSARDARLAFFREMQEQFNLRCVALGHTRNDQAETVLYRLLRGAGTAGLSGIRPTTTDGRIRPLIRCSRADIIEWLTSNAIRWREDRTNSDERFDRNRIRHSILPMLAEFSPAIPNILAATAEVARAEEEYWADEVARVFPEISQKKLKSVLIRTDRLNSMQLALGRRVIRAALAQVRGDLRTIDLVHIERVIELARKPEGHGRLQVPGLDIMRSFEWLRIAQPRQQTRFELDYAFAVSLGVPQHDFRICGSEQCISLVHKDVGTLPPPQCPAASYNEMWDELDVASLDGALELRNWHPGDELHLLGKEPKKIKQFFQDFRIPLWDRHLWPVLTCGTTVVWAQQFGVAGSFMAKDTTRSVLRITTRSL